MHTAHKSISYWCTMEQGDIKLHNYNKGIEKADTSIFVILASHCGGGGGGGAAGASPSGCKPVPVVPPITHGLSSSTVPSP